MGQHFLIDEEVLAAIVEAAAIEPEEKIVEIGPGIGILTRELLKKTPHVTAIEIDQTLIPYLKFFIASCDPPLPQPSIINQNALQVPFPDTSYSIVANIPYHITSPLLRHAFLEGSHTPRSLTLLIQREVAEKICDTKDAGLLTIMVGLFGKPRIVRHVPPSAFLPPPKVDSSVLHIACFEKPKADMQTIERVLQLIKLAFGQKRKMLRNTIASLPGGADWMEKAKIDPTRRPQTLSIEEWIRLAHASV